jgi:type I site-specific restriction endonuclease
MGSIGNLRNTDVESEIRDVLSRYVTNLHQSLPNQGSVRMTTGVSLVVQRVATTSTEEIDKVIAELQGLREHLRRESERVQREIGGYQRLNQSALDSAQVIANVMTRWKAEQQSVPNRSGQVENPPMVSRGNGAGD